MAETHSSKSILDRVRARQGITPKPEAAGVAGNAPADAAAVPPPAGAGEKPRKKPKQSLIYLCGHAASSVPCPDCRHKAREEKRLRRKARREARAAENRAAEERRQADAKANRPVDGDNRRLPDGAVFDVRYDAAAVLWSGTLAVGGQMFTGQESGVFRLLRALDQQYRAAAEAAGM